MFAAQGPERATHFPQEALPLVFIDAHDFIEQAKIVTRFPRYGAESHDIFREARTAVANTRIQEPGSNARIGADAVHDLIHVGSHGLADRGHGIDEREIFMARKALEACLMSSALLVLVTMMGAGI